MDNFYYSDEFYREIGDLMEDLEIDEDCSNIPDDWKIECKKSSLEPLFQLSADWILERIDEERFTEDGRESEIIYDLLKEIDFSSVNERIPKLYYEIPQKFIITKQDLLNYCKPPKS